jgi:hypothetical protein
MRNLRRVWLSIFNKLLKAQGLRNGLFVRVLPEEPFFCLDFPIACVESHSLMYCRVVFREFPATGSVWRAKPSH